MPPSRIDEQVVNHNERLSGESKYGISRTFRVIIDLLFMWFFMRFRARPGHLFGSIGLIFGALGSFALLWLAGEKFLLDHDIGGRPLFMIAIVLIIASIQLLTTGILAEMLARIYFESSDRPAYIVRDPAQEEPRNWFAANTRTRMRSADWYIHPRLR
ncbi:MAG: hypothetical protein R3E95_19230 [Thiolinea sp.]